MKTMYALEYTCDGGYLTAATIKSNGEPGTTYKLDQAMLFDEPEDAIMYRETIGKNKNSVRIREIHVELSAGWVVNEQ